MTFSVIYTLKNVIVMQTKIPIMNFWITDDALIHKISKTDIMSVIQTIVFGYKANMVCIFELVVNRCPHTCL